MAYSYRTADPLQNLKRRNASRQLPCYPAFSHVQGCDRIHPYARTLQHGPPCIICSVSQSITVHPYVRIATHSTPSTRWRILHKVLSRQSLILSRISSPQVNLECATHGSQNGAFALRKPSGAQKSVTCQQKRGSCCCGLGVGVAPLLVYY